VTGISEASPNIIGQALTLNLAVVINKNILGGWKYVNEKTGAFYNSESDVLDVIKNVLVSVAKE
jgi:hypothetical protein